MATKPRVVLYSSIALEPWDWTNPWTKGIGGSETAHIEMAERLAKAGFTVESFAPIPGETCFQHKDCDDEIRWTPFQNALPEVMASAIWIVYRDPKFFDRDLNPKSKYYYVAQDVDYDWTPERLARVHRYICLCQDHVDYTLAKYPQLRGRVYLSTNGIRTDYLDANFQQHDADIYLDNTYPPDGDDCLYRDPHRLFYASSPDRGLLLLLQSWRRILERVPDAVLRIAYGFNNMAKLLDGGHMNHLLAQKPDIEALLNQPNVTWLGRLNQHNVYREWFQAAVFPYFNDFAETSCISVMEAQACGAIPVTNALWALRQNVFHGVLIDGVPQDDPMCRAILTRELCALMLDEERQEEIRGEMIVDARTSFDWAKVARQYATWIDEDWSTLNA